jgi:hypothetical protein
MHSVTGSQFIFNLEYQDTVIKIQLEKLDPANKDPVYRNDVLRRVLESISTILRTTFFSSEPVYLELTNIELDHVVIKFLALLWQDKQYQVTPQDLVLVGDTANLIAFLVQERFLSSRQISINNILPFLLFSGVVWWSDPEIQKGFQLSHEEIVERLFYQLDELMRQPLAVNDFPNFFEEILRFEPRKNLVLFLDDNGEMVWELLFIRLLLDANPKLTLICIVNTIQVTNNCSLSNVLAYLNSHGKFLHLLKETRFELIGEPNELAAVDLRFISPTLREKIDRADIFLVNGVSYFEKLQYMPKPTYYLFTVYSETSKILTGFERNAGIFSRLGPHLCGFSHIQEVGSRIKPKMVLKGVHAAVQSSAYRAMLSRFQCEADANLWLIKKTIQSIETVEEIIYQSGTLNFE